MSAIGDWLRSNGFEAHVVAFERNQIEIDRIPELSGEEWRELGVPIGHRKRMVGAAQAIAGRARSGERRHVSAMFCDVVGSSAITASMDLEDMLALMRRYHALCRDVITRFGGTTTRITGDGVFALFGWPVAIGNDAERATRAALEIARASGTISFAGDRRLRVRVAIDTGMMLVGEATAATEEVADAVVGGVVNRAAKLQALAPASGVLVTEPTHEAIRGLFEVEAFGTHRIAGIPEPTPIWLVTGETSVASRFRALRGAGRYTPLVQREHELDALRRGWRAACRGEGTTATLVGEAGIGKSRLLETLVEELGDKARAVARLAAGPLDSHSPLHPVIAYLSRAAGILPGDRIHERMRKLERSLHGADDERAGAAGVLRQLIADPTASGQPLGLPDSRVREQISDALVRQFEILADSGPLLMTIEDVHWLDPTSLELLERLALVLAARPALIVFTSRTATPAPWRAAPRLIAIEPARLTIDSVERMVRLLAGDASWPPEFVRTLAARTDGVPLFVEEVVRSIKLDPRSDGDHALAGTRVPGTLHELLAANLDRAGDAKRIAQAAAVIGRSARIDLVAATAGIPAAALPAQIDVLTRTEVVYRDDSAGGDSITFRHALVRDVAYESLTRADRRTLHGAAATALAAIAPQTLENQPELIAFHLTEAGHADDAVPLWLRAGRRDLARTAVKEAASHLAAGLRLAHELAPTKVNLARRLDLTLSMAAALIFLKGAATPEVEQCYQLALDLCRELPESPNVFATYWGWWRIGRDFDDMLARANQLLERAIGSDDNELLLQAHHCKWASHFHVGDLAGSADQISKGLRLYGNGDYRHHVTLYGSHDAKVCAHGEASLVYWQQGFPERAAVEEERAIAWAREIDHDMSIAHAMDYRLVHRYMRRDAEQVAERARELIDFSVERGFTVHHSKGLVFQGWADAVLGDPVRGLTAIARGYDEQRRSATAEDFPFYVAMLAEVLARADQIGRAILELDAALAEFGTAGLKMWGSELLRWRALLALRAQPTHREVAEAFLERALEHAAEQGAVMLELRAAATALEVVPGTDVARAAAATLARSLEAITEGRALSEWLAARALLERSASGPSVRDAGGGA